MRNLLTILLLIIANCLFAQTPTANAGSDKTIYLTIICSLIIGFAAYVIIQFLIGSFEYKLGKIVFVIAGLIIALGLLIFFDVFNYVIVKCLAVFGIILLILIYLVVFNNLFDKD